jgi:hypothetical protein
MTRVPSGRIRTPFGSPAFFFVGFNPSCIGVGLPDLPVAACTRLTTSSATGVTLFSSNLQNGYSNDNIIFTGVQPVIRGQTAGQSGTKCKASDIKGNGLVSPSLSFGLAD